MFTTFEIEVHGHVSIDSSIKAFLIPDLFDDYPTENGKITVKRFHSISQARNYFFLQLKRFDFDSTTGARIKINYKFEFLEVINLSSVMSEEYLATNKDPVIYDLTGIIMHHGLAIGGHYFSYIFENGNWRCYNDTVVFNANSTVFISDCFGGKAESNKSESKTTTFMTVNSDRLASAYLLFYQKRGIQIIEQKDSITLLPPQSL